MLTSAQTQQITTLLDQKIEAKLKRYARETASMPFLARLMQDSEKVAAYSFIHSLATTLGMSIYEESAKIIASGNCKECFTKYGVGGVISRDQKSVIENIVRQLRNGERKPNIKKETAEVLIADSQNGKFQKDGNIADFFMIRDGKEFYFEIKTVKPNIDVFTKSKAKLLEWVARKRNPVKVFLAFPYNPYYPEPYSRFTDQNLMDHPNDFLIGAEFWDFLGGKGAFDDLLTVFDVVGKKWKSKIQQKIHEVAKSKMAA